MWSRALVMVCLAGALRGQPAPDETERKEKARELIEKAVVSVGAVEPETQVMALMQLATAMRMLDPQRSVPFLEQAFAAASALQDNDQQVRGRTQAEVVKAAAQVALPKACEMLRAVPGGSASEARLDAAAAVVRELLVKKQFDDAIEALALTPEDAAYPFAAAQNVFEDLPEGDSRRIIVFGNAAAAYRRNPGDSFRPFLAKHWKEVPRDMAQAALGAVVNGIRDRPEEAGTGESLETAKGTIKLSSSKTMELFDLLPVIRALDPGRTKEILEQYADLRAAAQKYPDGRQAIDRDAGVRTVQRGNSGGSSFSHSGDFDVIPPLSIFSGTDGAGMEKAMREFVAQTKAGEEALEAFEKDHNRGLSLADHVRMPVVRVELLARFAKELKKDPAEVEPLLSRCRSAIAEIKDGGDRIGPSLTVAELEHDLKNDQAAWQSLEAAFAGVAEVYKSDTDSDLPNRAPRAFWPSLIGCRRVVWESVKLFGVKSEALLANISAADLLLVAQVEMAGALVKGSAFDAEHQSFSWQVVRTN